MKKLRDFLRIEDTSRCHRHREEEVFTISGTENVKNIRDRDY